MPITTYTYGDILAVPVSNVINKFSLGTKLVRITGGVRTNLAICKAILGSNFDNTGVFDLVKPMFVMELLSHVLDNACKEGVLYMK